MPLISTYSCLMTIGQFFGIVEIRTKIISLTTFAMGLTYAYHFTGRLDPLLALIMLVSVLCVDMGTTGFNAYFDYRNGTDRAQRNSEKNKVLLHQGVAAAAALQVSVVLFAGAVVTGIVLAVLTSWYIIPVGAVCMGVGYLYTGGPYPISRTPLGELAAGGFLGTVLFMITWFVQTGTVSWNALLVSLSSSALVASILTANNTCDLDTDREAGRFTLSIIVGRRFSAWIIYLLGGGAYLWAGLMIFVGWLPALLVPFLAAGLIVTIINYRNMHAIGYSEQTKDPIMGSVARLYLLFGAVYISGLIVTALTG